MVRKWLKMMLYENEALSLTRIFAASGWAAFIAVSLYLAYFQKSWPEYGIFASYTGGGGGALQIANKLINSKYNSVPGSYDQNK